MPKNPPNSERPHVDIDKPIASPEAERFVLGSIMLVGDLFSRSAETLDETDFSLRSNRIIWACMAELAAANTDINRVTLANCIQKHGHLEAVGGLTYLVSLDDGVPQLPDIESYVGLVKEKSALRRIMVASQTAISKCMAGEDAASILADTAANIGALTSALPSERILNPGEFIEKHGLDSVLNPKRTGISTGFDRLDDMMFGFEPGKVYILGGDASQGKSSAALQLAMNVAEQKRPVLFFTLEMSYEELIQRMACSDSGVPAYKVKRHTCDPSERHALMQSASRISEFPLYVDDTASLDLTQFTSRSMRMVREKGINLIVLDYIQIMNWMDAPGGSRFRDEREAFSYISRVFKMHAKQWGVSILVLSQLTKERARRVAKDLRPKLGDLYGTGSYAKDADVVMFVYRPEFDHPGQPSFKGKAELIIRKQRSGPTGIIPMLFNGKIFRFTEVAETDEEKEGD
jgi:replicative DNA helicase